MRNRFKGLDLIDRVPVELWMEIRDIVQETGIILNLGPTLVNEILAQQLDNRLKKCLFLALCQEHGKHTFRLTLWEEGT